VEPASSAAQNKGDGIFVPGRAKERRRRKVMKAEGNGYGDTTWSGSIQRLHSYHMGRMGRIEIAAE
jgi:hypothetical protein